MAEKRVVSTQEKQGCSTQDRSLVAVLLAAGAVLKLTVSSFLTFAGMKPNFMIAMYCLAIILVRPKLFQAALIGFITGLISQIPMLNATPLVNLASETLGALVCGILVLVLAKVARDNFAAQSVAFPAVITFLSTLVSGYTFALIVGCGINGLGVAQVLLMYVPMVFGTAGMNAVCAAILTPVLKKALKRA